MIFSRFYSSLFYQKLNTECIIDEHQFVNFINKYCCCSNNWIVMISNCCRFAMRYVLYIENWIFCVLCNSLNGAICGLIFFFHNFYALIEVRAFWEIKKLSLVEYALCQWILYKDSFIALTVKAKLFFK